MKLKISIELLHNLFWNKNPGSKSLTLYNISPKSSDKVKAEFKQYLKDLKKGLKNKTLENDAEELFGENPGYVIQMLRNEGKTDREIQKYAYSMLTAEKISRDAFVVLMAELGYYVLQDISKQRPAFKFWINRNGGAYELWADYANLQRYREAIALLNSLPENDVAFKMKGRIYEEMKDYISALNEYGKSSATDDLKKYLSLAYGLKIVDKAEKFDEICLELQLRHCEEGFEYPIKLLREKNTEDANREIYRLILDGFKKCSRCDALLFEAAYGFENGIGCERDDFKSHMYYGLCLNNSIWREIAIYNYSRQLTEGIGCEKDEEAGKRYLEYSGILKYRNALTELKKIHGEDGVCPDPIKYKLWNAFLNDEKIPKECKSRYLEIKRNMIKKLSREIGE